MQVFTGVYIYLYIHMYCRECGGLPAELVFFATYNTKIIGEKNILHCMLWRSSGISFFWFCQRSPARTPEHQIKTKNLNVFSKNKTKITTVTIIISVWGLLYLTDPIHSTKRYSNHNGFRDISWFMGPLGVWWKGPGSIWIPFIIREPRGIISESSRIWLGWLGWPGWLAARSPILWFINKNPDQIYSKKKEAKPDSHIYT